MGNSLYGVLSNAGFRYFDLRNAEAITLSGQLSSMHVEKTVNQYFNSLLKTKDVDYAVYLDTDSCVIHVDALVKKIMPNGTDKEIVEFLLNVGKHLQDKVVKSSTTHICELCNCKDYLMDMKLESIAKQAFFTGKKKYAIEVHNSEGVYYDPPKLKITGLEVVRSSTPFKIRKKLKECISIIFSGGEEKLINFVGTQKDEFLTWSEEDISFPRSVSDIDKYEDGDAWKSGTPIAVRGAILYNNFFGNGQKAIYNGDKIKFCYLKMPNPIKQNVIAYPTDSTFPDSLRKYVDKETMWEKGFIAPIKNIAEAIDFNLEETSSLGDFFA